MKKIIILITLLTSFYSCKQTETTGTTTTVTKYVGCTASAEGTGKCIRWMDRTIYLAYSTGANPTRNNEFQKAAVKTALQEIEQNTMLGRGYWTFKEVDESLLNPVFEAGLSQNEYKSFILIWDDVSFNDFVVNTLGGSVPDLNAVTIINSAYKRKFYMILRASCFTSSSTCNNITTNGINALIARQIGMLTGLQPLSCSLYPNDVMCASVPNDNQWSLSNKAAYFAAQNGMLEVILNNPNYYDEYVPSN